MLNSIKSFFYYKNSKYISVVSLVLTFIIGFISYNAFIVYGYASPDGLLEGMHFYINRGWAIAGCGRWFLALIDIAHGNMVFPWLTIMECILVNWLSIHTVCKIFKIDSKWCYFVLCMLFSVIPTFIEMCTYTNSAFAYSLSVFLSILFVYINLINNRFLIIISAVCLGFAMGAYQSQIGLAVGLIIMCIIMKIIDNEKTFPFILRSLVSGILAIIVYVVGLKICLRIFGLVLFSRASTFSLKDIIINFFPRFIKMYTVFFNTFNQAILKRKYIYIVLLLIFIFEIACILIKKVKENKVKAIILLCLVLILPSALNIIGIILPSFDVTALMLTPNYFIIPFIVFTTNYLSITIKKIVQAILCFCILLLTWTYVLSANATYDSYRLSYNVYKTQFSNAIDEVLDLEDYKLNTTRIIVIGRPSDKILRDNIHIYRYAINLYNNLLYWETTELDPSTTNKYIIQEFGIDPGIMEYEEYVDFINLDECKKMTAWPADGSIKMINDCAVIKFSEAYE